MSPDLDKYKAISVYDIVTVQLRDSQSVEMRVFKIEGASIYGVRTDTNENVVLRAVWSEDEIMFSQGGFSFEFDSKEIAGHIETPTGENIPIHRERTTISGDDLVTSFTITEETPQIG